MGVYISRDKLIEQTKARIIFGTPKFNAGLRTAIEVANFIPVADVVEVRHGRWIEVEHGGSGVLCECSACKEWMLFYYGFDANYCPSCGAKMDGEKDNG